MILKYLENIIRKEKFKLTFIVSDISSLRVIDFRSFLSWALGNTSNNIIEAQILKLNKLIINGYFHIILVSQF